ncbi:hypothetical protein FLA_6402 [Filimonas lacunae]|nr:hypothetical protein FLA_6402 [Filimonas lacunae]
MYNALKPAKVSPVSENCRLTQWKNNLIGFYNTWLSGK